MKQVRATKYLGSKNEQVQDTLAVEEMLSISVNGEPYTITMRMPGSENELVRGILLTEDVYTNREQAPLFIVTNKNTEGVITQINSIIPIDKVELGIETKRNLMSVTSCGMCGKTETDLALGAPLAHTEKLSTTVVENMFFQMRKAQKSFELSGGTHASAAFTIHGKLLSIQEDIGRHNAVDKVIGDLLLQRKLDEAKCILVSGRLSYEIVSKAYKAGIPFLAAVSAPSSMAVEVAETVGITLMAFCRGEHFTVYSCNEAISIPL